MILKAENGNFPLKKCLTLHKGCAMMNVPLLQVYFFVRIFGRVLPFAAHTACCAREAY